MYIYPYRYQYVVLCFFFFHCITQYIYFDLGFARPLFVMLSNSFCMLFLNLGYLFRPDWRKPWRKWRKRKRQEASDDDGNDGDDGRSAHIEEESLSSVSDATRWKNVPSTSAPSVDGSCAEDSCSMSSGAEDAEVAMKKMDSQSGETEF